MTQPPVHAIASYYVHANANDKEEAKAFLERIFPKLIAFHDYLVTVRDPENSGAITIMPILDLFCICRNDLSYF